MSSLSIARRGLLALAATLIAPAALGQGAGSKPRVLVETGKGAIMLELEQTKAPLTVANFLRYVDERRYDGSTIYRASRAEGAPTIGLIEGGLQYDTKRLLPPIAHESTTMTGLTHQDGTISMARDAPGTATADFFICCGPAPYLDAHPGAPGDNLGYAAFGQVVDGMDIVRAILASPTTGAARNPQMQGQMIDPPVPIAAMTRAV
jgi:peptidyl-prolyl cis-trans isomerase A (cyclophilin A)